MENYQRNIYLQLSTSCNNFYPKLPTSKKSDRYFSSKLPKLECTLGMSHHFSASVEELFMPRQYCHPLQGFCPWEKKGGETPLNLWSMLIGSSTSGWCLGGNTKSELFLCMYAHKQHGCIWHGQCHTDLMCYSNPRVVFLISFSITSSSLPNLGNFLFLLWYLLLSCPLRHGMGICQSQ